MEREPGVADEREASEELNSHGGRCQKTTGFARTTGQDYEVALCCLFFLRALRLTSEFFLYSNHSLSGKFDDVVLFYKFKADQCVKYRAILLQAKHKEKTTEKNLTSVNPFCLMEYFNSFRQVSNQWKQPLNMQSKVIEFMDVQFVLYTNTGCSFDCIARDVTEVSHLRDFINTGGRLLRIADATRLKLPQEPELSDFVRCLTLCIEQMSIDTTDRFLEEEISNLLGLTLSDVAKELISALKNMVRDWWREKGESRCLTAQSKEWRQVLDLQVARLNADTLTAEKQLSIDFTATSIEELKLTAGRPQSWICVRNENQAMLMRVRLLKSLRNCLVLNARLLESSIGEVDALWGTVCPTLAIDMSSSSPLNLLLLRQMVVHSDIDRHLVVIANEKPTEGEWFVLEPEPTWSVLNSVTKERLLSINVNLQGSVLELRNIIGVDASNFMSDHAINSLCFPADNPMKLGELISTTLEYYVARCLQRRLLETIRFESLTNTHTLIIEERRIFPIRSPMNKFRYLSLKDLKKKSYISGTIVAFGVPSDAESRNLCCKFNVRGLRGEVGLEGFKSGITEFVPFTWLCQEKVVIVEGVPGVGKSSFVTAMCSSVKERYPNCWVLRIDMGKQTELISSCKFKNAGDIKKFLMRAFERDLHGLERDIFEHSLYVMGNVFLFVDAFDEINPDFTVKCCHLLRDIIKTTKFRQMVITTRPITTNIVEIVLGIKAFSLPVFSQEDQMLFLKLFCASMKRNIDEEKIFALRHSAGSVLEIPLLCKMAAELMFYNLNTAFLDYRYPWRRVLLYKSFVEQSVYDRPADKLGVDVSNPALNQLFREKAKKQLKRLEALAVRKLMQVEQMIFPGLSKKFPDDKFGLVVHNGEGVDFEHQTFAEYFLGHWLAKHWQQCQTMNLRQVLSRDELVAATFSWFLLENVPLHRAVAQGDQVAVKQLLGPGTTDTGGRSALHIAAMTQGKQVKVLELLLDSSVILTQADNVLDSTAVKYAETCRNWEFVDVMITKRKPLQDLNIFTNRRAAIEALTEIIKEDLTNLYKTLLKQHRDIVQHTFDYKKVTHLHVAASHNSVGIMKVFIDMCQDVNCQDLYGETPLHECSTCGHKEAVQLLLENGGDPNIKSIYGDTALLRAIENGHLNVVRLLIKKEVNPKISDEDAIMAFTMAARKGDVELVKLFLDVRVNPNAHNAIGYTALMMAASKGHLEVVKLLKEKGGDLNIKNGLGNTAIILAAVKGHLEVVRLLLELGADQNTSNANGDTTFMGAAAKGHVKIVKLLLEEGANPNTKNENDDTALMMACHQADLQLAKILLEKGAYPNLKNANGDTALIMAAHQGNVEFAKLLLEKGADQNLKNANGDTALTMAARQGNLELSKLLLAMGADPNRMNGKGETALMLAARRKHLDVMKLLINNGADPNLKNANGRTAFMQADRQVRVELDKILIRKEADPNTKNSHGDTAFMIAVYRGDLELTNLLLTKGADANVTNNYGVTAFMMASREGHIEIVKRLLEIGGLQDLKNINGDSAFMLAVRRGHLKVVKLLIEKGANTVEKNTNGDTAFMVAARKGYLEIVKLLVEGGANLNLQNTNGDSAFMMAARRGQLLVVKLLLQKGADPNLRNVNGDTALILAAHHIQLEILKLLLEIGAVPNVIRTVDTMDLKMAVPKSHIEIVKLLVVKGVVSNLRSKFGKTAIRMAAGHGNVEVVKLLIEKGADPNLRNASGETILMLATRSGHLEVMKLLVEKGADANLKNENGNTAFMLAARQGLQGAVELLVQLGADPNVMNDNGDTAFTMAASKGLLKIVKLLIDVGADPNQSNKFGTTAVMVAALQGHLDVVKLLIEKGAHSNATNSLGSTAFMMAAGQGHLEIVKLLIENGADTNAKNELDDTAFMMAADNGQLEIAKLLIEIGANPNINEEGVNMVFVMAAYQGDLEVVKLLIDKGVDPTVRKVNGDSAVMMASHQGHLQIVQLLIEKGADPNLKNKFGDTGFIMAAAQGHLEVVKLLIEKGADPNTKSATGDTAFIIAAHQGNHDLVKLLLEKGANPNVRNSSGDTAFIMAARQGNLELAKLLLENGADPNIRNANGDTGFMLAFKYGYLELVELLLRKEVDLNIMNANGETAFIRATGQGKLEIANLLQ